MFAGTVASVSPFKEAQLLTIPILEECSDETGTFNETFTARFTWHDSKKASINAMQVKAILSVVCKWGLVMIVRFLQGYNFFYFFRLYVC